MVVFFFAASLVPAGQLLNGRSSPVVFFLFLFFLSRAESKKKGANCEE